MPATSPVAITFLSPPSAARRRASCVWFIRSRTSPCRAAIRACAASALRACSTVPTVVRRFSSGCTRGWSDCVYVKDVGHSSLVSRRGVRDRVRGVQLSSVLRCPILSQRIQASVLRRCRLPVPLKSTRGGFCRGRGRLMPGRACASLGARAYEWLRRRAGASLVAA